MSEEQSATQEEESALSAEAIQEKMTTKAPDAICPFCKNKTWFILRNYSNFPVVMLANLRSYPTYSFSCTNCGFVRQHIRSIVDGEIMGDVDYTQSGD